MIRPLAAMVRSGRIFGTHPNGWLMRPGSGTRSVPRSTLPLETSFQVDSNASNRCSSARPLCAVYSTSGGTIEDAGHEVLHLDFANAYMGGGVIGNGCVQEEIRFLLCPELIVSRLLAEGLGDNEAIRVVGFDRVSNYRGYGSQTFEYGGRWFPERFRRSAARWARLDAFTADSGTVRAAQRPP